MGESIEEKGKNRTNAEKAFRKSSPTQSHDSSKVLLKGHRLWVRQPEFESDSAI